MTGRLTKLPCDAFCAMLKHRRIYTCFERLGLGWTGSSRFPIRTILYLVALILIAAPALAAVPPVPQSRPALRRLEAPASEARANGAEAAKLHARLATR